MDNQDFELYKTAKNWVVKKHNKMYNNNVNSWVKGKYKTRLTPEAPKAFSTTLAFYYYVAILCKQ
jgi:hypothetical protein